MEKTRANITRAFFILFSVCFTFVIINTIFNNEYHKTPYLIIVTAACIAGFAAVYYLLGKCGGFLEKNYGKILIIFAAAMFVLEIVMGLILRHDTWFDIGAVNQGAVEWVETGTFAGFYDYFYSFPNNLGSMMFLYVFFKLASIVGITDYYAVAVFLDAAMVIASMVLVSLICKRLSGVRTAVFALVIFAVSAQYWFIAAANYTDTMSMLFPILIFYLYLRANDSAGRKKLIIYILTGAVAGIGGLIKFTSIIMVIGLFIDMCLKERIKETAKAAACIIGAVIIIMTSFDLYMYSTHLDRETAKAQNTPILHWTMMGLAGNGTYNGADYEFTRSFAPEERNGKLREEIVRRLDDMGPSGVLKLAAKKSAINFGDGTYGISDFLNIYPARDTRLHDWVLYGEKHYGIYSHYATSVHIAVMIFMLLAAYVFAFARDKKGGGVQARSVSGGVRGVAVPAVLGNQQKVFFEFRSDYNHVRRARYGNRRGRSRKNTCGS